MPCDSRILACAATTRYLSTCNTVSRFQPLTVLTQKRGAIHAQHFEKMNFINLREFHEFHATQALTRTHTHMHLHIHTFFHFQSISPSAPRL